MSDMEEVFQLCFVRPIILTIVLFAIGIGIVVVFG